MVGLSQAERSGKKTPARPRKKTRGRFKSNYNALPNSTQHRNFILKIHLPNPKKEKLCHKKASNHVTQRGKQKMA